MDQLDSDEELAASAVASLSGWKRSNHGATYQGTEDSLERPNKVQKSEDKDRPIMTTINKFVNPLPNNHAPTNTHTDENGDNSTTHVLASTPELGCMEDFVAEKKRTLLASPFFYYRDFSQVTDDDPLTPLTPPARVPNFPAKMHAILSRPDLSDIIAWMPHGRSWRVLKPREFEVKIIPTYFEHQKFSSFIRQANGWGFRRITQGRDRNSYYHELFLRGLPHLCKQMKRPGVSKKAVADPDHEPDFYKISELHQVPSDAATDELTLLPSTVIGGPKARMPVHFGALSADYTNLFPQQLNPTTATNSNIIKMTSREDHTNYKKPAPIQMNKNNTTPELNNNKVAAAEVQPQTKIDYYNQIPPLSTDSRNPLRDTRQPPPPQQQQQMVTLADLERVVQQLQTAPLQVQGKNASEQLLGQMHHASASRPGAPENTPLLNASSLMNHQSQPSFIAAASFAASSQAASQAFQLALQPANDAASQFAAGFAAATALNNSHVRSVINQALAASNAAATSAAIQAIYGAPPPPSSNNSNVPQENNPPSYPPYGGHFSSQGFR